MAIVDEHEAFKNRLVNDVLGQESGENVPMAKVVMLIWQFRHDPSVVTYMAQFVQKYAGIRKVFDGVEFYLPQLAHMIIHLEAGWDDSILERFALVIAQQSLHFALQLNWILNSAIEDYQPELPSGLPNPTFHPLYYARCMKLLSNLERCVVYGRPRSKQFQRLYEQGKITKSELHVLESTDRRFHALQITEKDDDYIAELEDANSAKGGKKLSNSKGSNAFGGTLLYKRGVRLGCFRTKGWKKRYFVIDEQMLNCYRTPQNAAKRQDLIRAMPLEGATYEVVQDGKYQNMFIVSNRSYRFLLRASSEEDRALWLRMLEQENDISSLFQHNSQKNPAARSEQQQQLVADLTPSQLDRYDFFRNERQFVQRLTDIAEELRFEERAERKKLAPGKLQSLEIPPCVYLPLTASTDVWRRVTSTFHKDTRVFNTKERCPVVMYFLVKLGEERNRGSGQYYDVAEYIHHRFEETDGKMSEVIEDEEGEEEAEEKELENGKARELSMPLKDKEQNESPREILTETTEEEAAQLESPVGEELENPSEEEDESEKADNIVTEEGETQESSTAVGNKEEDNDVFYSAIQPPRQSELQPQEIQPVTTSREESLEVSEVEFKKSIKMISTEEKQEEISEEKQEEMSEEKKQEISEEKKQKLSEEFQKSHSSKLWHVDDEDRATTKEEKKQQGRQRYRDLPRKLASRMDKSKRARSVMDLATDLQIVPILEGAVGGSGGKFGSKDEGDNSSVGSIERGSKLFGDKIQLGDLDEGDIDIECINRAKQIVSGGESWAEKSKRMLEEAAAQKKSAEGTGTLEVSGLMSKSNDDLRQEVFVMQMIHFYKSLFAQADLPIWLKTYRILSTSKNTGLLEFIVDSTSLDALKKSEGYPVEGGLREYFTNVYGPPGSRSFQVAQANFMQSLVGYSLVSYFLGLKDRHNGNIMIDTRGHLLHIDFGFAMGMKPGHEFGFERAPFKLTKEYVDVLDGPGSKCYKEFQQLFLAGFLEARKNSQLALGMVEIMMFKSNYPCFKGYRYGGGQALRGFEKRLMIHVPEKQVKSKILGLIETSRENTGTFLYDKLQLIQNGYAM